MAEKTALDWFAGWFEGNRDFYVLHQPPFAQTGTKGKLKASWVGVAEYGTISFPAVPNGKEKGDYVPVTRQTFEDHLAGKAGLALSPIGSYENRHNVCWFAVIDIDTYGVNYTWLIRRLYEHGFKFSAFRSKSGGLHLYFFFADAEPAAKVIGVLTDIVDAYGLARLYTAEIFPKQAVCAAGTSQANCIFLPYFNAAHPAACPNKMITLENKLINIDKGLPLISSAVTTVKELEETVRNLPYSDAPYCTQSLLLSGYLSEGDKRNNFLCHTGIYLKKKYADDFYPRLQEANACLLEPLDESDLQATYKSIIKHSYDKYWCNKEPCKSFCDKKSCKKREFGVKQGQANNKFTGADCWGNLHKILAKEPYYRWEVRVNDGEEFRILQIDSVSDLQNQAAVQRCCLRDLNWMPYRVSDNDWAVIVNKALEGVHEREIVIDEATDTSDLVAVRNEFLRYLASQRTHSDAQVCLVGSGRVYHGDGGYYFITEGFTGFLDTKQINYNKINLRELLVSYGCRESSVTYTGKNGKVKTIRCWKKDDDSELDNLDGYFDDVVESDGVVMDEPAEAEQAETDEEVKF